MSAREVRAEARHAELGLSDQDVLQMYYYMVLARTLDERMWQLQRAGKAMFVISGPGHEGAQVGMMWPLDRERDWFVPYYRSVAAVLVKGMTPTEILLAVLAKATDPSSGGRQMPGHYAHVKYRILSTSSPVGTQYPHAAGLAYAAKVRRTGEVVLVTIGDGGTSQGDWHEALNFAAIHKVPCLFAVENNRYAISVPLHKQMAVPSVAVRAQGYGMPGVSVDGSDVLECYRVRDEYLKLVARFGDELRVLEEVPLEELERATHAKVAEGIRRMREGRVYIEPGYDGEFGRIHLFEDSPKQAPAATAEGAQMSLF